MLKTLLNVLLEKSYYCCHCCIDIVDIVTLWYSWHCYCTFQKYFFHFWFKNFKKIKKCSFEICFSTTYKTFEIRFLCFFVFFLDRLYLLIIVIFFAENNNDENGQFGNIYYFLYIENKNWNNTILELCFLLQKPLYCL